MNHHRDSSEEESETGKNGRLQGPPKMGYQLTRLTAIQASGLGSELKFGKNGGP